MVFHSIFGRAIISRGERKGWSLGTCFENVHVEVASPVSRPGFDEARAREGLRAAGEDEGVVALDVEEEEVDGRRPAGEDADVEAVEGRHDDAFP